MNPAHAERPTPADAIEIATRFRGRAPHSVHRFATGIGHWVYEIRGADGVSFVVRMATAEQRDDFLGAAHWSKTLRPLGLPLPELLARGELRQFPYLVLERLDGDDLGTVYRELTAAQRQTIAAEVCRLQRVVGTLPQGRGYGFVRLPAGPYRPSWSAVVDDSLGRSRNRIEAAGLLSPHPVHRVEEQARGFRRYFSRVRPTPFLDDATTKNVLVHEGRLSGIVDVDWLCFGDPLFTVALTRTSLLSAEEDCDYTDYWCELLNLTAEQRSALRFYTALFCVDFMSEIGQRFNRAGAEDDPRLLARLERILDEHLDA